MPRIMLAPFLANWIADAHPIPDDAPVISTTFSLKFIIQKAVMGANAIANLPITVGGSVAFTSKIGLEKI